MAVTESQQQQTILVTGGAGFIGTHTVVQLLKEGFNVSIIDNLDNSITKVVDRVRDLVGPHLSKKLHFHLGDLRNKEDLEKLFSQTKFDAVIHFAGLKAVGESVVNPHRYFDNNLISTINLYEVMAKYKCQKVPSCCKLFDLYVCDFAIAYHVTEKKECSIFQPSVLHSKVKSDSI